VALVAIQVLAVMAVRVSRKVALRVLAAEAEAVLLKVVDITLAAVVVLACMVKAVMALVVQQAALPIPTAGAVVVELTVRLKLVEHTAVAQPLLPAVAAAQFVSSGPAQHVASHQHA
jgi:hypothetical protein